MNWTLNAGFYSFDAKDTIVLDSPEEISRSDEYLGKLKKKYHARQMILLCMGPNGIDCQDMFSPVLTDSGICYSFMPHPINDTFKTNPYIGTFKSIFMDSQFEVEQYPYTNLSASFEIFLILDSHQSGTVEK